MYRLLLKFLYRMLKLLEGALYHIEYKNLMQSQRKLKYPPIFIVGPPRSGTTLLYQLMIHRFYLSYFPNIANWFNMAPVAVTKFALRLTKPYVSDFTSNYGEIKGIMAPSEAGGIWNRWYPTEDKDGYNYTPKNFFNKQIKHLIYQTVAGIEALFDAPFINKNVKHSVRILSLVEIFPNALFLRMIRDPYETAISILRGRKKIGTTGWWSVMPKEIDQLRNRDYIEQIAGQVYFVERNILADMNIVGKERFFEVYYDDICANPRKVLDKIAMFYKQHGGELRIKYQIPLSFKKSKYEEQSLSKEERQLRAILSKYYKNGAL